MIGRLRARWNSFDAEFRMLTLAWLAVLVAEACLAAVAIICLAPF